MTLHTKHARFVGHLLIVGFGSIGQGVLPLLMRHIDLNPKQTSIIAADLLGKAQAESYGISFENCPLTKENYEAVLSQRLKPGDFLLNLSVTVSSVALIEFCHQKRVLYLDTCIEPWAGGYTDPALSLSMRSNYAFRESILAHKERYAGGPTAVLTHGANPGLVSHFVKQGLLNIAKDTGVLIDAPKTQQDWGRLAHTLGIKVIHIAERDTQVTLHPKKPGEFVNTWSIDGFASEGSQPAELGWGTHEKELPSDARRHEFGCDAAIYLLRPGCTTRVRTWTPLEGALYGFLITHNEAISIADYFTLKNEQNVIYRPTVHYAYHPCDDAVLSLHEFCGKEYHLQPVKRLIMEDITTGMDELGVLLMGHEKGAYWYGSQLSIEEVRRIVPNNNATSLQVTVSVLAGMIWALNHPDSGVQEADALDYQQILDIAAPYLGRMAGQYTSWTPLEGRARLFPEEVDYEDPWQFKNFRVL